MALGPTQPPTQWVTGATRYAVMSSRELLHHDGMLVKHASNVDHSLKKDVIPVQDFYEDLS
jgi:hypothetical protein